MESAAEICVRLFKSVEMPLGAGLTTEQLDQLEADFGFIFHTDHRQMLSLVTPLGKGWLDWRTSTPEQIRAHLSWPREGIVWDVDHNDFWPRMWRRKPKTSSAVASELEQQLKGVPTLVPLRGHRFMAAGPSQGSCPVFSVYQTDVVYYGENLPDYVARELDIPKRFTTGIHRKIPFWSSLAENDRRYASKPPKGGRAFWNRSIDGPAPLPEFDRDGKRITYTVSDG